MKLLLLFVALGIATAIPNLNVPFMRNLHAITNVNDDITVNINQYFDNALETISAWLVRSHMDPLPTPDIHKKFSKKIGVVTWHGQLDLTNGVTTGLSSIKRNDAAILSYENQLLHMHIPITFEALDIKYHYHAEFMSIHADGDVDGHVKDLELHVDVQVDTKTTDILLQTFEVSHAGDIDVKFSGNKAVDWFMDLLAGVVTGLFHDSIKNTIEKDVKNIVQEEIDKINNLPRMEAF